MTEETTTIALEAALFDALSVRRTSKQFNLRSESSARALKEALTKQPLLCDVAAAMIASLAGGEVLTGAVVGSEVTAKAVTVTITLERINGFIRNYLDGGNREYEIFDLLSFTATVSEGTYSVTATETLGYSNRSRLD